MFLALVKRKGIQFPELFGCSNVSHGELLATMEGVEWVQLLTVNGAVLAGARASRGINGWRVEPITPSAEAAACSAG